ncbi:MAG: galactose-1-phosphate uridylyltransferase [Litorimonas sp.]
MIDTLTELPKRVADKRVYRRHFQKADGRDLLLYGYSPHNEVPLAQDNNAVATGGELRWHPLRREWNVYAPHRQARTFKPSAADDPLAPSVKGGATTEIPFVNFELAVFENKFTSLHARAPVPMPLNAADIKTARAKGRCDVIVYSPDSIGNLHSLGQDKRRLILSAWNDRYQSLFDQGCEYVLPFENRGDAVGVTLSHPHGQIYAFPFVPQVQSNAACAFAEGYNLEAAIKTARPDYEVTNAGGLSAFCPPFARFPFEVWIAPETHAAGPWAFNETQLDGFAHLLGDITRRYDEYFQAPTSYMLSLHAAPRGANDTFHFTAQFYPLLRAPNRVKYLASVEQATGAFTVDVMPEMAAKTLRVL